MVRVSKICLISVVVLAALAFGGTEGPYFSVVQVVLLGLGVLLLATYSAARLDKPRLPVAIPLLLVALVLLQIAPLPSSVVQLFGAPRTAVQPKKTAEPSAKSVAEVSDKKENILGQETSSGQGTPESQEISQPQNAVIPLPGEIIKNKLKF